MIENHRKGHLQPSATEISQFWSHVQDSLCLFSLSSPLFAVFFDYINDSQHLLVFPVVGEDEWLMCGSDAKPVCLTDTVPATYLFDIIYSDFLLCCWVTQMKVKKGGLHLKIPAGLICLFTLIENVADTVAAVNVNVGFSRHLFWAWFNSALVKTWQSCCRVFLFALNRLVCRLLCLLCFKNRYDLFHEPQLQQSILVTWHTAERALK